MTIGDTWLNNALTLNWFVVVMDNKYIKSKSETYDNFINSLDSPMSRGIAAQ